MFLQIFLLLVIFVLSYYVLKRDMLVGYDPTIKVLPWNFPWVGHLPSIIWNGDRMLDWIRDNDMKYGTFYLSVPLKLEQLILCNSEPAVVKHILTDNFDNYVFPSLRKSIGKKLLGQGIFRVDGESWKIQRDLAKPMFQTESRKGMVNVFLDRINVMMEILDVYGKEEEAFDFQELIKKFTLDTFGLIGFGSTLNALTKDRVTFCNDFDWVENELELRTFLPFRFVAEKEFNMRINRMDAYVMELLKKRRTENLEGKIDLLSTLIVTDQTDTIIRDSLINFFIAGRDTTASLLTWTFVYFSKYPEIEKKVIEEFETVLGNSKLTFENLKDLTYLKMVLYEVLRLCPAALPLSAKQAVNEDVLPNGKKVKAGQVIFFSPYVTHTNPRYWGEDAQEFRPSRWEKDPIRTTPYIYYPFLRGPRSCLGKDMAMEEAKAAVVTLLRNGYRLRLLPGQNIVHKPYMPVIFGSKNPVMMRVVKV